MLVYIPQSLDCPKSLEGLRRVELEALHDHGLSLEFNDVLGNGPDGGCGTLAGWGRVGKITAYRAASQEWHKLPPSAVRTGDVWIGWDLNDRPSPTTLARRRQVGSRVIQLGDGDHWLLPTVDAMPKTVGLDAAGNVSARLVEEWESFVNDTESFLKKFRIEETEMFVSIEEAFRYCAAALAKNYRLVPELISILNLIRDEHFASIPANVLRYDLLAEAA